ncbi:MAG TPA: DUF2807 domain-containing protein [Sphingomicrobium sp.]|nr:DUF2807 domain-containing protein [Sphingomicrobium sp.]
MRSTVPLFLFALAVSAPAVSAEVVPLPYFHSVELRGGGTVIVVPGPAERVTVLQGSTQFTSFRMERDSQLKIDACNERCPEHYNLVIQIESPRVPALAVTGGGLITTRPGFAPQSELAAAVRGGGRIDARALDAAQVAAAVDGGGDLFVRARSSLAASVDGGGDIRYWGNPSVASSTRGGGSIERGY